MSVNEELLCRYGETREPAYRIYEPAERCIVLGAGRKAEADVFLDRAAADGLPVLRRRGGGGTVLLTPGQVVLAVVTEVDSPFRNREYAARINCWFVEALELLGVQKVQHRGISDLAILDRKILGTSIYRSRGVLFYQASLLVDLDLAIFERYLRMPDRAPEYRRARSHEEFCTTLRREGYALLPRELCAVLEEVVRRELPLLR